MANKSNPLRELYYFLAGIAFLCLAKVQHMLRGYASPKPFNFLKLQDCIDYDRNVVDSWLHDLKSYTNGRVSIKDKTVLELGPGSDLGIGLYLLSKGCRQYHACDVNDLVKTSPVEFYDTMLAQIGGSDRSVDIDALREQLLRARRGEPSLLNYVVAAQIDLPLMFEAESIDIVFSQAALEHFDDIDRTIEQLSKVCKPGATVIVRVDLKTHSRWIREVDPNNIYRYPDFIYNLFWFRGIPNRVRPYRYVAAFERNGWKNVSVTPVGRVLNAPRLSYAKQFTADINEMGYLSVLICACKD